jgi:hypothetical protein
MAISLIHVLNEHISYASVSHDDLKTVFDKFKKTLKKIASTGVIVADETFSHSTKISVFFADREYEIRFTSGFFENVYQGKISAWRESENGSIEIGFITFRSKKERVTDPLTKAEGSITEPHFCRVLLYAWLLKDLGWDMAQIGNRRPASDMEEHDEAAAVEESQT